MGKKGEVGDILEIPISEGYCYGQITHNIPKKGCLITVFKKNYNNKQTNYKKLSKSKVLFRIYYFMDLALKSGLVEIIANVPVCRALRDIPIFKISLPPELTGGKHVWRLVYIEEG